jgi:hypothetical protein
MQGYQIKLTKDLEQAWLLAERDLAYGAAMLAKKLVYPTEAFEADVEDVHVRSGTDYAPRLQDKQGEWLYIKDTQDQED